MAHPGAIRVPALALVWGVFGFFGEYEEVIEDLLRKRLIGQQFAGVVGYDEIVGTLAIANGKRMMLLVLNDSDDLEFQTLAFRCFNDQNIA